MIRIYSRDTRLPYRVPDNLNKQPYSATKPLSHKDTQSKDIHSIKIGDPLSVSGFVAK
jgi:hypothetical protein